MKTRLLTLHVIFLLIEISQVWSYKVSVVEYMYKYDDHLNPTENLKRNVAAHVNIIRLLKAKSEIVVFPEGSLCPSSGSSAVYFTIPDPSNSNSQFSDKVLQSLSAAASYSKMYVVLTLPERSGANRFSTSIVFNRNGTIATRSRKYHLYDEDIDTPSNPEVAYFDTDFGLRFGLFTSLDIIFQSPAQDLIKQGIKYFVYPSSWTSTLPFLVGNQVQQSWAWVNDVTLLAAGLNQVSRGRTGSGIFRGRQGNLMKMPSKYYTSNTPTTMVITGNIFNDASNPDLPGSYFNQDPRLYNLESLFMRNQAIAASLGHSSKQDVEYLATGSEILSLNSLSFKQFESELLSPDENCTYYNVQNSEFYRCETSRRLCQGNVCCDFDVTMDFMICSPPCLAETLLPSLITDDSFYLFRYRMAVLDGVETPWKGGDTLGLQVCSIVSCLNSDISSCGVQPKPAKYKPNVFNIRGHSTKVWAQSVNKVSIAGYFTVNSSTMIFPSQLLGATEPSVAEYNRFGLLSNQFQFSSEKNTSRISLPEGSRNLGSVAIINRIFSRDGFPARSSQHRQSSSLILNIALILLLYTFSQHFTSQNHMFITLKR